MGEQLSRLLNQHAESLLRQGRGQLLASWLNSFPPTILNNSPWLLFWLGQCQLPRDPVAARHIPWCGRIGALSTPTMSPAYG